MRAFPEGRAGRFPVTREGRASCDSRADFGANFRAPVSYASAALPFRDSVGAYAAARLAPIARVSCDSLRGFS